MLMKRYTGRKNIEASPMTKHAYQDYQGITRSGDNEEGYIVEYKENGSRRNHLAHDNYISWSPKDVFEKAYKPSGTLEERLDIEIDELGERIHQESNRIMTRVDDDGNPIPLTATTGKASELILISQIQYMLSYRETLLIRKANFRKENELDSSGILTFDFRGGLIALDSYLPITRLKWEGKRFIFRQLTNTVEKDKIEQMKSLPRPVKDVLVDSIIKGMVYQHQIIELNYEGELATLIGWTPTCEDLVANDWLIFGMK